MEHHNVTLKPANKVLDDGAGPGPGPALMGAHTLLGNDVCNSSGEKLGDIKEFMIDMSSGNVAYAVLSYGGLLGMGDKLFAVPWAALALDTVNKRFTLDIRKDVLKGAPGFDKERWPAMSDQAWVHSVHQFYGTSAAIDPTLSPPLGSGTPPTHMQGKAL